MRVLLLIALLCVVSCVSSKPNYVNQPAFNRDIASEQPLITYCAKETAPASTPDEKKWRDAFSLEVMERICNKDPSIAKLRIDFSDWMNSKYLETSWAYGLNLTGVQHGWPRGTLITPRHMISTKHYGFHGQIGDTIYFLSLDNRLITRKVIEFKYLDNADLAVIRLDSDLPGSIAPLRVLDPEAFKLVPDLVPMLRIEQQSKALLLEKIGSSFRNPGETWFYNPKNPPQLAYAQYYQDMIRFDSSSPTLLLLRNDYGVMPILFSLVTFGGVGQGPIIHQYLSEIQSIITSFGDSHQLQKAMPPLTPPSAPSCSLTAKRSKDGNTCDLTVTGSADPVTGNPVVTPVSPTSWTIQKNTWTGNVACSDDPSTVFYATLSGPGGTGRTCESGAVGPILPQCDISVVRRGATEVCDLSVTALAGNPVSDPQVTPHNPSDWNRSGNTWTSSTFCALNSATTFAAQLNDHNGMGPKCTTTVSTFSDTPICELSVKREFDYSDTCEVTVTRKSGVVSGQPFLSPVSPTNWTQDNDQFKGTVPCSSEDYTTFSAALSGPSGTGPNCTAPSIPAVPKTIPFCELEAARQGLTNVCKLTVNFTRGWTADPPPVASPNNPTNWQRIGSSLNYEGTTRCLLNGSTQFSAYYPFNSSVPGRICKSAVIPKIPAPTCHLQWVRQGTSSKCSYTLSRSSAPGTIASMNWNGSTIRTSWDGSNPLTGQLNCSQIADTPLNAFVWGPGLNVQSGTCGATVAKLPPPSCRLTAQRRQRTGICDLTLVSGGVIDTSKSPQMSPSGFGKWNGAIWNGTATCGINRSTTFTATIYGPGGSRSTCSSAAIPKL